MLVRIPWALILPFLFPNSTFLRHFLLPSDPFWESYLPPNGWNCRCTTMQVRKGKYPQSNSEQAIVRGNACTSEPKQQIFRFNPGK